MSTGSSERWKSQLKWPLEHKSVPGRLREEKCPSRESHQEKRAMRVQTESKDSQAPGAWTTGSQEAGSQCCAQELAHYPG